MAVAQPAEPRTLRMEMFLQEKCFPLGYLVISTSRGPIPLGSLGDTDDMRHLWDLRHLLRTHPPLLRAHPQPLQNPGVERAEPKARQTFPMGPAFLRDEVCCLSLGRMTAPAVIPWLSIPGGTICTPEEPG